MVGTDDAPALAIHPTRGWAAVLWVNHDLDNAPTSSTVYVKTQDPRTHAWHRESIAVSTRPAYAQASHPAITIDLRGRIHVVFGQDDSRGHYSRSDDGGRTWTGLERLPIDGSTAYSTVGVDALDVVHVLVRVGGERSVHLTRAAGAREGARWSDEGRYLPGTKHNRSAIAFVGTRILVAAACEEGCGGSDVALASRPVAFQAGRETGGRRIE